MNAKISVFVTGVEAIIYLFLCNLHDCTFKNSRIIHPQSSYFSQEVGYFITYSIVSVYL